MALKKTDIVNASEIRAILGPVNDDLVLKIMKTGASRNDVMQAAHWFDTGEHSLTGIRNFANDTVSCIHDILMTDRNRFLPDD